MLSMLQPKTHVDPATGYLRATPCPKETLEREIKEWSEVLADDSHPVHHLAARVLKVLEAELHFTNTGKFPERAPVGE